MRTLAAIFAVFMSVTTGGPLRCPCQLTKLCLPTGQPGQEVPAQPPAPTQKCGCNAHSTDEQRTPADNRPEDRSPGDRSPCHHGPAADLAAPASGERLAGDFTGNALPLSSSGFTPAIHPAAVRGCRAGWLESAPSSQALLRYTHSFRC